MAAVAWTGLGSPGGVLWARAGRDTSVIAVGTAGGHLHLRRRTEAGWRWERAGVPPTAEEVIDAALITTVDGVVPVVLGGDLKVWLHQAGEWVGLAGPAPEPGMPHFVEAGELAAGGSGQFRHTLVACSAGGRPWMRQGVDPDGVWFRITSDDDWIGLELDTAFASVAAGSPPQLHIFARVQDRETYQNRLRIGVLENSVWTWVDPGGPAPNGQGVVVVSAGSFRDGGGRLQACAILGTGDPTSISMVVGSGRDWRWVALGVPPDPRGAGAAVVAAKGPDPRPGDEPVIVARSGHELWTRTLTGAWRNLGTTPGDVAVVSPAGAYETAAGLWGAGVSWDSDLWTFESDGGGVRWEAHGSPGSLVSVVGSYTDAPEPETWDLPIAAYAIDEHGALWHSRVWGNPSDGFYDSSSSWISHGTPAPGVTCARGVGVHTVRGGSEQPAWAFVVGSDGRLWARTASADGRTWVDHGAPAGRSIKAGVPPVAGPIVHVLADDGRLWMRSRIGGEWRWTDRETPAGQLIFALVGAATLPASNVPVVVAVTGDGHLWASVPDGGGFRWTDLGTPNSAERIAAGIGVEAVPGSSALDIAVVGSPSGQVWTRRWTPGGAPGWTAHGRPGDARVRDAVGTMPDGTGCSVAVVGYDQQVWVTSSAGGGWTRWDPPSDGDTVTGGKAAFLLEALPCAVVLGKGRRLYVVTPRR
ncbi:hypothetical protein Aph01nite_33620 [Acrocarpospora phusangensis]|uniref:Uncharacterized protein n=1 Tax=Acrocarpospora phusangensis TaxID=1070424 RepID=A0A919UNY7_9ACTN|nr:hypothetical protein [Acrocarpospora phusangensis]GIH25052.1 hypothetical protein Aph01nite_33620 [Acrocarpospora phusangensis]